MRQRSNSDDMRSLADDSRKLGSMRVTLDRLLLAAALTAVSPRLAHAFVCTAVPECPQNDDECVEPDPPRLTQAWNQRCIPFWVRTDDPLFSGEREALVLRSAARWTADVGCTDLELLFIGYADEGAGFDNREPDEQKNMVLSATDPAEAAALFGRDSGLLAITLTSFSVETGEIFDSDIVFNDANTDFDIVSDSFRTCALSSSEPPYDLENTLVHEFGHFIGFDHVDDQLATMYIRAGRCETTKRTLAADDQDGVCTTYATGAPVSTCQTPESYDRGSGDPSVFRNQCERALDEGCGCRAGAGRSGAGAPWAWALVLIGLLLYAGMWPRSMPSLR